MKKHPSYLKNYHIFMAVLGLSLTALLTINFFLTGENQFPGGLISFFIFIIAVTAFKHISARNLKCPSCKNKLELKPHVADQTGKAYCKKCKRRWDLELIFKHTYSNVDDNNYDFD